MTKSKYSVSLVYYNIDEVEIGKINTMLKCMITDASNADEALGKAIDYFYKESKGCPLSNKLVLKIN